MRVSPIGFTFNELDAVLIEAEKSATVTHDHHEGIKGAQAVASAVLLARTGESKKVIKTFIESRFEYDLNDTVKHLQGTYIWDSSCQGSVPQAMICFLESNDFEPAIRLAVSIGGDSDTIACICGGIAQAYYGGVPESIKKEVYRRLTRSRIGEEITQLKKGGKSPLAVN